MFGRVIAAATCLALAVSACGTGTSEDAPDVRLSVAAGLSPLAEIAERVGDDRVAVRNLTPPGAEPHDVEVSSDQMDAVLDADVVLYVGGGFQPAVEDALDGAEGEAMDVLEAASPERDGALDPHVWLDPVRMARIVERVGAFFARLDPEGAEGHRTRAKAYAVEIRDLHRTYAAALETCERRLVLVTHAAFGHLTDRYDLEQAALSGLSPEAEPDPRRLAHLADLARERGATTVFTEPLVSPRVAETLAREADLAVATLDPVETLPADAGYSSVMRDNLGSLTRGLGCR